MGGLRMRPVYTVRLARGKSSLVLSPSTSLPGWHTTLPQIQASNGASDYGNKFGDPVIHGFTRSFGQRLPGGERYEHVKPIMFSAGIGQMDAAHAAKGDPEVGMWVVKVGGPAYRIGLGGGTASSRVGDAKTAALDFNAVQRGGAELENRLMRTCVELGEANPIVSVHDQVCRASECSRKME